MKPFYALSRRGRISRLRQMAMIALTRYGLLAARLSPLKTSYNTTFMVDTQDGQRFVLRISYPGGRLPVDILSELSWLTALNRDTNLAVPVPIPTRNGESMITLTVPGIPEPRHCVLFSWLNGRKFGRRLSLNTITQMGAVMARLHNHADIFKPPGNFCQKKYNRVWFFGPPAHSTDSLDDFLNEESRQLITAAHNRVQSYLDTLYTDESNLRFVHADFHPSNLKLRKGEIQVLDFDDSMWAFPVQDIGISMFYHLNHADFTAIQPAFQNGYTKIRPWPERFPGEIELCMMHRGLDILSYFTKEIRNPEFKGMLAGYLDRLVPRLKKWLYPHAA